MVHVKALGYVIRIIPAMFFKIVLSLDIKSDVTENDRKVILCNKCFGNYMKP